jgi:nicotinamide mononucleotide adenylyltransferase
MDFIKTVVYRTVNMSGGGNGVVFAVGRLNPPTKGHDVLVQRVVETARRLGARPMLYIVDGEKSGKDKDKNPLTGEQRAEIARGLFPGVTIDVVGSAYEVLEVLDLQYLSPEVWVAGTDRAANYRRLLASEQLDCEVLEVDRSAGDADGVSATAARRAALSGDMDEFAHHMPSRLEPQDLARIAEMIREVLHGRRYDADSGS